MSKGYNVVLVPKVKAWGEKVIANYPTKEEAEIKAKWEMATQTIFNERFLAAFGKGTKYVVRKAR